MSPTLAKWFEKYSSDHQDHSNKRIHFICVPLIFFSLLGLASLAGFNLGTGQDSTQVRITLAYLLVLAAFVFYARHSVPLFFGIAVFSFLCLLVIDRLLNQNLFPAWAVFTVIFAVAWIGQFIGHKHEGKRPSFLTDLVFLLIGPAWILGFIYRKMGIKF